MAGALLDYRAAQQLALARVAAGSGERVNLAKAAGRVLAEDLLADWDLPRYDNSAMDGFAVRSCECVDGTTLRVVGTIAAGGKDPEALAPGTAVRIMTGAPLPPGADAIVPFEMAHQVGADVRLMKAVTRGDHVRLRGEDLSKGALVLKSGTRLTPAAIGMLATFGRAEVVVFRRPQVAVLATGNELVEPGRDLGDAHVYDANSMALCAAVLAAGGVPVALGIARDDRAALQTMICDGLQFDLLVTAAGASLGDYDLVRGVLDDLAAEVVFWGVAIKPGKPTGFALCNGTPICCLPGNPVSAQTTFEVFVRPLLMKMTGRLATHSGCIRLPLLEPMQKKAPRTLFARVCLVPRDDGLFVASAGSQQTGIMSSLVAADGLAVLPEGQAEFAAGEMVEVFLFERD